MQIFSFDIQCSLFDIKRISNNEQRTGADRRSNDEVLLTLVFANRVLIMFLFI